MPICDTCAKKVEYVKEPVCKKCGKPIPYEEKEFCFDCNAHRWSFEQGKSIWLHKDPVRFSIYQFKYHNRRIYGEFYVQEMMRLYADKIKEWGIDAIIPVPLHWKRRYKRGYNQAEILAKHLGKQTGIKVDAKVVKRIQNTKPQKMLSHKERKKNMHHAFQVNSKWKPVKNVLLVDDIYTTGNTIEGVARALKEKGVNKVFFLTISIGQGF